MIRIKSNISRPLFLLIFIYCLLMVSIIGCDFEKYKSKATIGTATVTVDENLVPLMTEEIKEFERLNVEAKIDMRVAPTKNVFAELINGQTNLIVVPRDFSEEEKAILDKYKIEVKVYKFAIDGIAFIVNPKNPISRVTSEDLKKIFTGEYKKWNEIKSQDEEQNKQVVGFFKKNEAIKLFIQRKNSFIYDYVLDSILMKAEYVNSAVICSTSTQILNSVRENVNSIGIVNASWLSLGKQDELDTTLKTLRISKIWPNGKQDDFAQFHQGLIYNKQYPYTREIFVITSKLDIGLETGFITFLLNKDGQKVVLKNALVPVTQPILPVQIK